MADIKDFGPVRFIQGLKGGRYPFCNSLFIEEAGILIDPSSDRDYLKTLEVQEIWLSHWHEDHIMHMDLFSEKTLAMHKDDASPLNSLETFIDWYGLDDNSDPGIIEGWTKMLTEMFHFQPRQASYFLKDGDIIDLGSVTVEVIHAPGHSPGNLAFFFQEPQILFLGDNDLTPFGPWYGDRYSNIDQIITTVERLKTFPAKIWLTGHEEGVFESDPGQAWDDYLAVIDQREAKLADFLLEPRTLEEIGLAWIVYGKPKKPVLEYEMMERISMKKHAERLIRQGKVLYEEGRYHLI